MMFYHSVEYPVYCESWEKQYLIHLQPSGVGAEVPVCAGCWVSLVTVGGL